MKRMTIREALDLNPQSSLWRKLLRQLFFTRHPIITPLDILRMDANPKDKIWFALYRGICGDVVREKFYGVIYSEGWAVFEKVLGKYHKNGNYWSDNGEAFREAWTARADAMEWTHRHVRMLIKLIKEEEINGKVHEHSTDES